MAVIDETPIYNLKAVVQETGLKPDTLRAWERRYGLPVPDRTVGGHRLYSQRDIELLKWLIARQDEGMSISRAVDLWRRLHDEGHDPLQMPEYALPLAVPASLHTAGSLIEFRGAWLDACLAFDAQRAERLLAEAFALYSPEIVCVEVLQHGLSEIGEGWYRGDITVHQEHFASALAMRRLEALLAGAAPPTRSGRLLIGCPPGEEHTFSARLLTVLLRRQSYEVIYLGANVPADRLEQTMAMVRPDLVIMPAQQLHTAASLLEVARLLGRMRIPMAFGGLIFNRVPDLAARIPAIFLGHTLEEAVPVIQHALRGPHPAPDVPAPSEATREALRHFRGQRGRIEVQVENALEDSGISATHLNVANLSLGRSIPAALTLGSMEFLSWDIHWVEVLLSNFQVPRALLPAYLQAYRRAAADHVGKPGTLIVDWLDGMIAALR